MSMGPSPDTHVSPVVVKVVSVLVSVIDQRASTLPGDHARIYCGPGGPRRVEKHLSKPQIDLGRAWLFECLLGI